MEHDGPQSDVALGLLGAARDAAVQERFTVLAATFIDVFLADQKIRTGDFDGAIALSRPAVEELFASGDMGLRAAASAVLVEALLARGGQTDLLEARTAMDRLSAVPTEAGFVVNDIWLLRMGALLAQAHGDGAGYRDHRDRYRALATSLGFEGYMKRAEAMP
jgi:adenylate cyclase